MIDGPWMILAAYAASMVGLYFLNRREFSRNPEKGQRYSALPLQYKMLCWFGVMPLFALMIVNPAFGFGALIAFAIVEGACVRWYRRHGLWP